ncbi:MAG TPA: heme-copper oxidase subunit III [Acidimicrobiales bacterium]|nr:heme-copper oxidase subunit III [Acidimicrobiales bacterium]
MSVASPGLHADRRPSLLAVGTTVWLASELMFFAGLFASYFTIRAANFATWPGQGVKLATARDAGFTLVLVASSVTMQWAVHQLGRGRHGDALRWIVATVALGAVFLANQAVEWTQVPFRPSTNAYGSLFFIMTGFHGLHVLFGLVAMGGLLLRLGTGRRPDSGAEPVAEVISYYWHFVDVVWIGLFITLFFIR